MSDCVAIVTGASRGIGRAIAIRLAGRGFTVVVNYASSADEADSVVKDIEADGGRATAVKADVSSSAEIAMLFDEAETAFGGIDVLVNNAGVLKVAPLAQIEEAEFDRLFAINVRGSFLAAREAARRMRDGGRIINLSSTTLALNAPGYALYNGTKGAVEGFTRVLANELGTRGITVNAVAPGPVETDLFLDGKTQEEADRLAAIAPARRLGRPEDIAQIVSFLASSEAGWVNGQVVRANGGIA